MENISFHNLYRPGKVVCKNELFIHYYTREMKLVNDYNEIQFKRMPSIAEFILAEEYLKDFHFNHQQNHLKFCFPDNEPLYPEMINFLCCSNYGNCLMELYGIHPEQFPKIEKLPDISIQPVTDEQLQTYLAFEYEQDIKYGRGFAEEKQNQNKKNFQNEKILQLLAYYKGKPAGTVTAIISEHTVELDNLIVLESLRNKGIGSRLQQYVMEQFPTKYIILVTDGYDTARKMYQKLHYQLLGYRFEVLKICEREL